MCTAAAAKVILGATSSVSKDRLVPKRLGTITNVNTMTNRFQLPMLCVNWASCFITLPKASSFFPTTIFLWRHKKIVVGKNELAFGSVIKQLAQFTHNIGN